MPTGPPSDLGLDSTGRSRGVQLRSIIKTFFGSPANNNIDFDIQWGEVHALLGENGAGKSTLCSVLAGLYRPDSGAISIDGVVKDFRSPQDALAAGIGMVYQHFRLVDGFTVAQNLILGHPNTAFHLSKARIEAEAARLIEKYKIDVLPSTPIWQLSVGEQQRVEILKLLYRGARVLILDEPTAVLTPQEVESLIRQIRLLAEEGRAVVFVSHKLDEVLEMSDRITVLRDGQKVGEVSTANADERSLATMMVGREVDRSEPPVISEYGEAVLNATGLWVMGDRGYFALKDIDLEVRQGEIVGIAGVAGNGQRELADVLAGLREVAKGTVLLDDVDITTASPLRRIQRGLGYIPEDRLAVGLAPGLPLEDNVVLKSHRQNPHSYGPLMVRKAIEKTSSDLVERFNIRGHRRGQPVRLLSGGNLQRLILARETSSSPKALVAASPTRGLDVAAIKEVHELLLEQAANGMGILLISEDLDELHALADRILVMYEGEIVGETRSSDFDLENLGLMMAGASSTSS